MKLIIVAGVAAIVVLLKVALFQTDKKIVGDGNVTIKSYKINTPQKIEINGVFKTILTPTLAANEVKVETDKNLQSTIEVIENEGRLIVRNRKGVAISSSTKIIVYIGLKTFDEMTYNSVGELAMPHLFEVDSITINATAVGKTTFNFAANFIRFNIKNVGETTLLGKAKEARINNRSVGKLNAIDFLVDYLYLHNEAIGAATVHALKEIAIRHSGVGTLSYKGDAIVKEMKDKGIGKIQKL